MSQYGWIISTRPTWKEQRVGAVALAQEVDAARRPGLKDSASRPSPVVKISAT